MLATATAALPVEQGWAYEFKWDGVRALLDVTDRGVHLTSRAGNDIAGGYPELIIQGAELEDALLDGEIVAFVDGRPSFERLQSRMHVRGTRDVALVAASTPVTFVAFDVLRRYGVQLLDRPYSQRRATLERLGAEHPGWTISPSFDDGAATESVARTHGLEGVVAKRLDSVYSPGVRSPHWRKLRFLRAGDFAVIGWEAAAEHPSTLSSLLLGVAADDGWRFAGKVGSGLSAREAAQLHRRLRRRDDAPVPDAPRAAPNRRLSWVQPEVVVEVGFAAVTGDGRLRQPVFHRVREDKRADEARGDA